MRNVITVQGIRQQDALPRPTELWSSGGGLAHKLVTRFAVMRLSARTQRRRRWRVASGEQRPQMHSVDYLAQDFPYHYGPGGWI
jgi:hypothetical protein